MELFRYKIEKIPRNLFWENPMELGFFFVGWKIPQKSHLWLFPLKNATKPFIDYQIFKFIDNNCAIGLDECARRVLEYLEDSVPWSFLPRNDPPLSVRLLRFRLKNSTDPTETETYLEILRELTPQGSQDRFFSLEKRFFEVSPIPVMFETLM